MSQGLCPLSASSGGEWVWLPYLEGLLRFNERIHEEQGREGQVPSSGREGDSAGETRGRDWVRFSGPLLLLCGRVPGEVRMVGGSEI